MKKWFLSAGAVALVLFGSVIGFNLFKNHMIAKYMANMPEPEFPVATAKIETKTWTPTIEAIGFVEPNQGVMLTAEQAGTINHIAFNSGTEVKEGELLVALDTSVERANLNSAEARLPAGRAKYERYRNLYAKNSISKDQLDEAEADYRSLIAEIESLQSTISRRELRAPFSGSVGLRNVYLGQYLQPGTAIVRLEDTRLMRLRFTVPQTEISKIALNQKVEIHVDAYPDTAFSGHISAIEPAVNYQSGLIQLQADIPNNDGRLRSGMFARASIILPTQTDRVVLPQTAITFTLYGESVYRVRNEQGVKRVEQVVVKVVERRGNEALIGEGLAIGEEVVLTGQVRLSNGAKVHVVENNVLTAPKSTPML